MSDPEPIDFDFEPPRHGEGGAGGTFGAGSGGAPGADEIILDPSPVADGGHASAAGASRPEAAAPDAGLPPLPARPVDPLHAHAAAARAAAADTAFAVSSYPYAPASIMRATPTWAEGASRGARREPWSRRRRLTMGVLLALLAVAGAAVIALSIRAIDAFLRGG